MGQIGNFSAMRLGPVATRAALPQHFDAPSPIRSIMSRSDHFAHQRLTSIQLVFSNITGPGEANNGVATTVRASVEYPEETCVRVTFGGSITGRIPPGSHIVSDPVAVDIPDRARFWIRNLQNNRAGLAYEFNTDPAVGSRSNYSMETVDSQVDLTMAAGSIEQSQFGTTPTAIVGRTALPGVCLIGDGGVAGLGDAPNDGAPDVGMFARSIGTTLPYISLAWSGEKASDFIGGHSARVKVANDYCTHVVIALGINDLAVGAGASKLAARMATIADYFEGKPIGTATLEPVTGSIDKWTSRKWVVPGSQTPRADLERARSAYNTWLRVAAPAWATLGVFDIARVAESAPYT